MGVRFLWQTPVVGICSDEVLIARERFARAGLSAQHGQFPGAQWCGLSDQNAWRTPVCKSGHYRVEPWSRNVEVYWGEGAQAYVTPVGESSVVLFWFRAARSAFFLVQERFPELARRLDHATCIGAERGL